MRKLNKLKNKENLILLEESQNNKLFINLLHFTLQVLIQLDI